MSLSVEKTGKTIQAAIQAALTELNTTEDHVVIEVLDEGDAGGLLGIGKKEARVRVSLDGQQDETVYYGDDENYEGDPETEEEAVALDFVTQILSGIGVRGNVSSYKEGETIHINATGQDMGAIIGRHGETLDAIQYLTSLVVNRNSENRNRVVLDIGGYRKRREEMLVSLARRTAEKVVKVQKVYEMEPMSPSERRIIHATLQDFPGIRTESEGTEPERFVVITPVSE